MFNNFKNQNLIFALLSLASLILLSCTEPNSKTKKNINTEYQEVKITRVKFNFNQQFEIKEIKKGQCLSDIAVSGIGFQNKSSTIIYKDVYPIENYQIADINNDGFEELYILTRSAGSGSYSKILGVTSNKGKNYKTIYIPEDDASNKASLEYLEGYMGHDSIFVQNNLLCRVFPVYKPTDPNSNPTGGKRKITYHLVEINNAFSLQVKSFEKLEQEK